MRANEFITEGRENYNGINILFQKDDEEVFVKASAGPRELGHVLFVIDGEYLIPQDLEVEERYRGQGIAQTMYDYVKSKGYKIRRSGNQTADGIKFWEKNRPEQNVWENVPQPGQSSGAPTQFAPGTQIKNRQMTASQIISSIPGVPYYNNVVDDWDNKDYSWGVTQKVIEYAKYLKQHPESLAKLPPIQVVNGQFKDGAHRVSAIWLLQQRMDPKNPLWKNAKLNVQFAKQSVAEDLTTGRNLSPATEKYIKSHKWKLTTVDPMSLDTDSFDDPFNRVIDIDTEHPVNFKEPIILHHNGSTIIDGFHRVYQAQRQGLKKIPAYIPV